MVKFTIPLPPITKKNSQRILVNKATGRPFIAPSEQYKQYEKDAQWFTPACIPPIDKPVNVKCLFYMPTRRRVDLTDKSFRKALARCAKMAGYTNTDRREFL